jgi:hypothetical protein
MVFTGLVRWSAYQQKWLAAQEPIVAESDRRLQFLDREIQALKNEMEIRKSISNSSILVAITRQEAREMDNSLRQDNKQNDSAVQGLSKSTEE